MQGRSVAAVSARRARPQSLICSSVSLSFGVVLSPSPSPSRSTDADLLPTRPPPKSYTPSGQPEFALLITPGRGKGCNLKKFTNLQKFLKEEAHF